MCSVNPDLDDDDTNSLMLSEEPLKSQELCRKCKESSSVVILQSKFPYCKACFIEVLSHKFFGCLGKSKMMKPTDRVLLLCSGSQSSAVLLNLIKVGLHKRHRKILSDALVLFIDAGSFLPLTTDERIDLIKDLKEMFTHFGFKSYYSPLIYSKDSLKNFEDISWCNQEFMEATTLKDIIEALSSSTAREDILVKLRFAAAVSVAKELSCCKIFMADTNDHIAANILTNVALGRGDQLPLDIGFLDDRFEGVSILRPLRDCSKKEIAYYSLFFNLPFVSYPKSGTKKNKDDSIQKLTEKFVAELQVSFPSTVCMVVGTGNKLALRKEPVRNESFCALCKGNKSGGTEKELSAVSATNISQIISNLGPQGFNSTDLSTVNESNPGIKCSDKSRHKVCSCSSANPKVMLDKVKNGFCYGCQLILNDMKTVNVLPPEVLKDAEHKANLDEMRKEINDFLL